jgi:tetratricopeptide (TPR) repeat protein
LYKKNIKTEIAMKHIKSALISLAALLTMSSCNDYLDVVPKGKTIPTTLSDFEAMMRYEYNVNYLPYTGALYLMNDKQLNSSGYYRTQLNIANYDWDTSINRVEQNSADESTYYQAYTAISYMNLMLENAPTATECTDEERNVVMATARVIRANAYFHLANYYADTYDKATASTKLCVPIIESANIDAPSYQGTIQQVYDLMISDLKTAIDNGLPDVGEVAIYPGKGAAYALLSRIYLMMGDYSEALTWANKALQMNDALYDWNAYYDSYKEQIEAEESYTTHASPMNYSYVENYYFNHGESSSYSSSEISLSQMRGEQFENGDAKFLSRWKLRTVGVDTYYQGTTYGFFNLGGITTVEVYLIKAECQARLGGNDFSAAMETLNKVRQTRIRPELYAPKSASTLAEAIEAISTTKANELVLTIVPFADARRLNNEGLVTKTFSKEVSGKTVSLTKDSYLWTMPFPNGAVSNPGNGSLTQNVDK